MYKILAGKSEGKRPLRRHRYKWDSNFKMENRDSRVDWIDLTVGAGGRLRESRK
jgi:hypothetical protein